MSKSALAVFDIDGMIIHREHNREKYTVYDSAEFDSGASDSFIVPDFKITVRRGLREFFRSLFAIDGMHVALWTSSNEKTFAKYLRRVLPDEYDRLYFIWDRSRCSLDPERGTNGYKKHSTTKKLATILESPILNENNMWNEKNVLIIDDDARKLRFNPESTRFVFADFGADINTILDHPFFNPELPDISALKISDTQHIIL